jgi:REP element-mobilizing transposase RayT
LPAAFRKARSERPFVTDAIVILPDHLHAILTLPSGDSDFSDKWRRIKESFTRSVNATGTPQFRAIVAANTLFGKSDFGNSPFVTNEISSAARIMCISIRSNTSW